MKHTPNRLETHWNAISPLVLEKWKKLNQADLDLIDAHFDRLVEILRQRYGGRAEIIQEAAIRDDLNQILQRLSESPK